MTEVTATDKRALSVLLVGPDGTGKSTVAAGLADRLRHRGLSVVTGHYRPGLLWKRSETPTTEPHAKPSRPSAAALVKVVAVYGDFVLGYRGPWRASAGTVVILERGWWDHVVDPLRYRLPPKAKAIVSGLGATLPKADVVVVLGGDADAIVARKPELDAGEVRRQLGAWRQTARRAGQMVIEIDTVANDADGVITNLLEQLAGLPGLKESGDGTSDAGRRSGLPLVWRGVPGAPSRVGLRSTGGPDRLAALSLYQPMSTAAKLAGRGSRLAVGAGLGPRVEAPIDDVGGLFAAAGVDGVTSLAAMDSSTTDRVVVGAAHGGELVAVAKVGAADDESLRNEGRVLGELAEAAPCGFRVPALLFAGDWQEKPAVVARALGSAGAVPSLDEALLVAVSLADIGGRFLTHGDLAPWNVRRTRTAMVLVDFEHAAWEVRPLADLTHFLVQTGALMGRRPPSETAALLCEPRGLGRRYLDAIGLNNGLSAEPETLVADYVKRQLGSGRATTTAEQDYLTQLGQLVDSSDRSMKSGSL